MPAFLVGELTRWDSNGISRFPMKLQAYFESIYACLDPQDVVALSINEPEAL